MIPLLCTPGHDPYGLALPWCALALSPWLTTLSPGASRRRAGGERRKEASGLSSRPSLCRCYGSGSITSLNTQLLLGVFTSVVPILTWGGYHCFFPSPFRSGCLMTFSLGVSASVLVLLMLPTVLSINSLHNPGGSMRVVLVGSRMCILLQPCAISPLPQKQSQVPHIPHMLFTEKKRKQNLTIFPGCLAPPHHHSCCFCPSPQTS